MDKIEEQDWSDEPSVERVSAYIWSKFNALDSKTFYGNDPSENAEQFKKYCLNFIEEVENELDKFKELVAAIKVTSNEP